MDDADYFDMRNLASPMRPPEFCPVFSCTAPLGKADSQWGELPYCLVHRIRIHTASRTFVYYNGPDRDSRRNAALRNVLFQRNYFKTYVLGNAAKAETHRICHETSEDALTWNVFSQLAVRGALPAVMSTLTGCFFDSEPELYLWGLRIALRDSAKPKLFPALEHARSKFEKEIRNYLTEPDIMLYIPGQVLIVIEAKFTSGNPVALTTTTRDLDGEKPKSREGILKRYPLPELLSGSLQTPSASVPFYAQLYRNLVFAIYMADELRVPWRLVNLVCERCIAERQHEEEFRDPTHFIRGLLPNNLQGQFAVCSWEQLYNDQIRTDAGLEDLAIYMYNKSANGVRALRVSSPEM